MPQIVVAQRMWQRRDTAANWQTKNPVLAAGEIGIELGATLAAAQRIKVGNGASTWTQLAYFVSGSGAWFTGTNVPAPALGADGDMYLRSNGDVYQKVGGVWTLTVNIRGAPGAKGDRGLSAYEVAVAEGFGGTQAQWVASLKGEKGDLGDPGPPGIPSQRRIQIISSTPTGAVTCDWSAYDEIQILLTASTVLTFVGALPSQGCIIKLRQDSTGGRVVTLPASVRFNDLLSAFANKVGPGDGDKLGFQYDESDVKYDFVSLIPGI